MATEAQIIANRTFKPNLVKIREICGYFFYKTNPICKMPKMNVNKVLTKDYENVRLTLHPKNKPNQTQFKPKTNPILKMRKMNVNKVLTRDYEENSPGWLRENKPNSNRSLAQIPTGKLLRIPKAGTQFPQRDIFSGNYAKLNRSSDIFTALLDTGKESSKC